MVGKKVGIHLHCSTPIYICSGIQRLEERAKIHSYIFFVTGNKQMKIWSTHMMRKDGTGNNEYPLFNDCHILIDFCRK